MSNSVLRVERRHEKHPNAQGDDRSPAQRDRDRILYSSSFRRLAEVTQVVAADSGYVFHNRLTHSLQVAQVGRRLAEKLTLHYPDLTANVINSDVVEAACLAHDLGHPPFGHIAEQRLNELAKDSGGFEGTLRVFALCLDWHQGPEITGTRLDQRYPRRDFEVSMDEGRLPRKAQEMGRVRIRTPRF